MAIHQWWCQIAVICFYILRASTENCQANELLKLHIIKEGQNFICQPGFGLFVPTDETTKNWPAINSIPKILQVNCNGQTENPVVKPIDSICNKTTCDNICKKYFTKEELVNVESKMNLKFTLPSTERVYWSGEFLTAQCMPNFYQEETKISFNKVKYSSESTFEIALKNCANGEDCEPTLNDQAWLTKHSCFSPSCNTSYAKARLNIELYLPDRAITGTYKFQCQGYNANNITVECVFDKDNLISSWAKIDENIDDLYCYDWCYLNEQLEPMINFDHYELLFDGERQSRVQPGDKFKLKCKPGFAYNSDFSTIMSDPFEATCISGSRISLPRKCEKEPSKEFFDNWWSIPVFLICSIFPMFVIAIIVRLVHSILLNLRSKDEFNDYDWSWSSTENDKTQDDDKKITITQSTSATK